MQGYVRNPDGSLTNKDESEFLRFKAAVQKKKREDSLLRKIEALEERVRALEEGK